jgi:lipopolysaccharide biosynthesis glycosyltransferase
MDSAINIAFVFDERCVDLCIVAAHSIDRNTKSSVVFYIVDCGISEHSHEMILGLKKSLSHVIDVFITKPKRHDIFERFPMAAHFSPAIFYKLSICETFPKIRRVLYLDCDVIVDGDIEELWSVDLHEKAFGVVRSERNFVPPEDTEKLKARVGIPPDKAMINSGVLLIDVDRFLQDRIFERVIDFVGNHKGPLPCPEQDAMTICLRDDEHFPMDPKFNFTPFMPRSRHTLKKIGRPLIIHYAGTKPWGFNKKIVAILYKLGLFRYSLFFIRKYWEYSDATGLQPFSMRSPRLTILFLYKRVFGKFEYFVAKKLRNGTARFIQNLRTHFLKRNKNKSS